MAIPQNSDRTAVLFCPPLPPMRLARDRAFCIGRQPSCELPLRRDDVSRRHAELRFEKVRRPIYPLDGVNTRHRL